MNEFTPLATYVIQNVVSKEIWTPNGPNHEEFHAFKNLAEANRVKQKLDSLWEIKRMGLFDPDSDRDYSSVPSTPDYAPPEGSVASKIKVARGEHVLICGEVQIGKLREKHELLVLLREQYKLPSLVLFRNNNVDHNQFTKRLDEFNNEQRKNGNPTIPQPFDILSHKDRLIELLKEPNVILGLANPETIAIVEKCMEEHPELQGRLVVIMDEADLVTFELEGKGTRTKTEENLRSLFTKIYMLVSVTGTPGSILLCDKMSQVYVIDRPENYYGIDRIQHVPVQPIRANKKHQQYDPRLDHRNLKSIMDDIVSLPKATLLISVSRLCAEHKSVISYLSGEYIHLSSEIIYLELNAKAVKVYNGYGKLIDEIDRKTFKGKKVAPIDVAIQAHIQARFIVIVAGVLAGRGVSFVSEDYTRHLTHQYIADPESCHLESAMQSVRLLGKYWDDPKLTLYCSEPLYLDLLSQCEDMKAFADLAVEARANKERMPNVVAAQKEYSHRWFPPRKQKGISYEMKKTAAYSLKCEEYTPDTEKFALEPILTNLQRNYPVFLTNDKWPGGAPPEDGRRTWTERVVYCNPLSDFTPEGIKAWKEGHIVKSDVYAELVATGYRHMDALKRLYQKYPEYEGKIIRRVEKEEYQQTHLFERRDEEIEG